MNGYYIRELGPQDLADRLVPFFQRAGLLPPGVPTPEQRERLLQAVPLLRERIKRLAEAPAIVDFLFRDGLSYDAGLLVQKGMSPEQTRASLVAARGALEGVADWTAEELEARLRPLAEALNVKTGQLFGALRVATTGRTAAPPLFETMAVLGRARTLERVEKAIRLLETRDRRR